jgi:hypothetical protein
MPTECAPSGDYPRRADDRPVPAGAADWDAVSVSRRQRSPSYACDVCEKPTSRLLGFLAEIRLPDGETTRIRSSVRGYCAAHRAAVRERFAADAAVEGTVGWLDDDPATLRPAQVQDWLDNVDRAIALAHAGAGGIPAGVQASLVVAGGQSTCPHCGERVSVGSGSHVDEAASRSAAEAWQCPGCGAAGLLASDVRRLSLASYRSPAASSLVQHKLSC